MGGKTNNSTSTSTIEVCFFFSLSPVPRTDDRQMLKNPCPWTHTSLKKAETQKDFLWGGSRKVYGEGPENTTIKGGN